MKALIYWSVALFLSISLSLGQTTRKPEVTWQPFPFEGSHVSSSFEPGHPSTKENTDGYATDYPPCTTLKLTGALDPNDRVEVFYVSEVLSAPYRTIRPEIKSLKEVLRDRPKLAALQSTSGHEDLQVPFYQTEQDAATIFQARVHYVDAPWGSGVAYLTSFAQDYPLPLNDKIATYYVFQGLSKDGKFYISGVFTVHHSQSPFSQPGTEDAAVVSYNKKVMAWLQTQPSADFSPDLAKLDKWMAALGVK